MSNNDNQNGNPAGFTFQKKRGGGRPGFHGLEVHLTEGKGDHFFEVMEMTQWVFSKGEVSRYTSPVNLSISAAWPLNTRYRLVPGTVHLSTLHVGHLKVCHFGGSLEIEIAKNRTDCFLSSPAPIFLLLEQQDALEVFLEETISLLAREHAKWGRNDEGFRRALVNVPPQKLYTSCLITVKRRLEDGKYRRISRAHEVRQFVRRELDILGRDHVPPLSALL